MNDSGICAGPIEHAKCPLCEVVLPQNLEPLTQTVCPQCGAEIMVPGQLGQYRLVRLLGKGGMGAVYEGVDDGLQRKIAVKVILKERVNEDPVFIENFKREAQAAARLNSPNIVGVYAFGDVEGQPYLVMELVQPEALDRMMLAGAVAPVTAFGIGMQIAQGLKAAAEQGLVHGDVKPENILINEEHQAKLADFGIAALGGSKSEGTNEVWGTPYYIAPETLRKQKVDLRADIYSLGGTLYHAIAGVPPFEGADAVEVMKARLVGPAKPLQTVAPSCPEGIAKVIMRMLEAEPLRRYPNYDALINDMKREMPETGSFAGKRIVLKPRSGNAGVTQPLMPMSPSRPMTSVVKVQTPLIKPVAPGLSKKALIGIFGGIGGGLLLLIGGLTWWGIASYRHASEKPEATVSTSAPSAVVSPLVQHQQLLETLSETVAGRVPVTKEGVAEAERLVAGLAKRAERATLPDQTQWLVALEGEAPTAMLRELQQAYGTVARLKTVAVGTEKLRAEVDGLRVTAMDATATAEAVEAMVATAQKAVEAWDSTTEVKSAKADLNALRMQQKGWRKTVDRARVEMESAVIARRQAEAKATQEQHRKEALEREQNAIVEEVASIATLESSVGSELDLFMPEAAGKKVKMRMARLKSSEAKEAAKVVLERIERFGLLKEWLCKSAKAGQLTRYGVTDAEAASITLAGQKIAWKDFVLEHQGDAFRILFGQIADDVGARALRASDRAELAVSARLFVNRYFRAEDIAKSKSVQSALEKFGSVADSLPSAKVARMRLEAPSAKE
ncbi:MAG: serine/threonine-protein kinase [Kiritimatiellia bacterium]